MDSNVRFAIVLRSIENPKSNLTKNHVMLNNEQLVELAKSEYKYKKKLITF